MTSKNFDLIDASDRWPRGHEAGVSLLEQTFTALSADVTLRDGGHGVGLLTDDISMGSRPGT